MLKSQIKYIWKAHITNWWWKNRSHRHAVRKCAFAEKNIDYLSKYLSFIKDVKPQAGKPSDADSEELVFSLWLQGEENAPEIVKKCLNSQRKYYKDKLIVLDENTISDYVDIPDYIWDKWKRGEMSAAHFSDIVRIELLSKYGGYWCDATGFIIQDMPDEIKQSDFFMFCAPPNYFPHACGQNFFIRAKKGSPLLDMWKQVVYHYWENEDTAITYYLVQLLFRMLVTYNDEAKRCYEKMVKIPIDHTYLLWYKYGNSNFSELMVEEMKKKSFFQKCSYKPKVGIVRDIIPGSMADYVINKN